MKALIRDLLADAVKIAAGIAAVFTAGAVVGVFVLGCCASSRVCG